MTQKLQLSGCILSG